MKNLLITEEEKRSILSKYTNNFQNGDILEEHSRITELMGIKTNKTLLLENNKATWFWTDLPFLSGFKKYFDDLGMSAVKAEIRNNMESASTLLNKYKTMDELWDAAHAWYKTKAMKSLTDVNYQNIIQEFLNVKHPDALADVANNLFKKGKESLEDGIDNQIDAIGFDKLPNELANAKTKLSSIDDNFAAESDTIIKNSDEGIEFCKKKYSEWTQKAKTEAQPGSSTAKSYNEIAQKYKNLEDALRRKKEFYETSKTVIKEGEAQLTQKVKVYDPNTGMDVEVDLSSMNSFQRFLWGTKFFDALPVSFFYDLGIVIKFWLNRNIVGMIESDVAALAKKMQESKVDIDGATITNDKEANALIKRLNSLTKAWVGRAESGTMETFTWQSFLKDGVSKLNPWGGETITAAWGRVTKVIYDMKGLTDVEKAEILELIKNRYMIKGKGNEAPTKVGDSWFGWIRFTDDLETVANTPLGTSREAMANAVKKAKEGYDASEAGSDLVTYLGTIINKRNDWSGVLNAVGSVFSTLISKFVNYSITGIPMGLRWVFRPLVKRGYNLVGAAKTVFNVWLTKTLAAGFFGGMWYLIQLSEVFKQYTGIEQVTIEGETMAEYKDRVWNDFLDNLYNQMTTLPFTTWDFGWEEIQKKDTEDGLHGGMYNYTAKLGVFKFNAVEWWLEMDKNYFNDYSKTADDVKQEEFKNFREDLQLSAQTKAKNVWANASQEEKLRIQQVSGFGMLYQNIVQKYFPQYQKRIYFNVRTTIDFDALQRAEDATMFMSENKVTTDTLFGFPFYCTKDVKVNEKGVAVCKGDSYRVTYCALNNSALDSDNPLFKKYIYNKDIDNGQGLFYNHFWQKLVYSKDESQEYSSLLKVGDSCSKKGEACLTGIGLVSEL